MTGRRPLEAAWVAWTWARAALHQQIVGNPTTMALFTVWLLVMSTLTAAGVRMW